MQLAKITILPSHLLYLIPSFPTGWTNWPINELHVSLLVTQTQEHYYTNSCSRDSLNSLLLWIFCVIHLLHLFSTLWYLPFFCIAVYCSMRKILNLNYIVLVICYLWKNLSSVFITRISFKSKLTMKQLLLSKFIRYLNKASLIHNIKH